MNTDKYPFKKTFKHTGSSFSATDAAEKWLQEKGYSVGTMQSPEPRGILREHGQYIPKWKHLSGEARAALNGVMTATDWRDGDVTVHLTEEP